MKADKEIMSIIIAGLILLSGVLSIKLINQRISMHKLESVHLATVTDCWDAIIDGEMFKQNK